MQQKLAKLAPAQRARALELIGMVQSDSPTMAPTPVSWTSMDPDTSPHIDSSSSGDSWANNTQLTKYYEDAIEQ
jgi:hypothetical protein